MSWLIQASFSKAAKDYERFAYIQKLCAQEMVERLSLFSLKPKTILDLGCGTGYLSELIAPKYPQARLIQLDISHSMLKHCRAKSKRFNSICANALCLPFSDQQFDLIISNAMLQWLPETITTLTEIQRVCRLQGLFLFSSFGPDTLQEWRQAWQMAGSVHQHSNILKDRHQLAKDCLKAGLASPVVESKRLTLNHLNLRQVINSIKGVGSKTLDRNRPQGLIGKRLWQDFQQAYAQFNQGSYPLTWEIIQGYAFKATSAQSKQNRAYCLNTSNTRLAPKNL